MGGQGQGKRLVSFGMGSQRLFGRKNTTALGALEMLCSSRILLLLNISHTIISLKCQKFISMANKRYTIFVSGLQCGIPEIAYKPFSWLPIVSRLQIVFPPQTSTHGGQY